VVSCTAKSSGGNPYVTTSSGLIEARLFSDTAFDEWISASKSRFPFSVINVGCGSCPGESNSISIKPARYSSLIVGGSNRGRTQRFYVFCVLPVAVIGVISSSIRDDAVSVNEANPVASD